MNIKNQFKEGLVTNNPVLVQLVGLCPVIAASSTFIQALMLSAAMCLELTVVCVIASAFFKNLPRWIRVPVYFLIGLALIYNLDKKTLNKMNAELEERRNNG